MEMAKTGEFDVVKTFNEALLRGRREVSKLGFRDLKHALKAKTFGGLAYNEREITLFMEAYSKR